MTHIATLKQAATLLFLGTLLCSCSKKEAIQVHVEPELPIVEAQTEIRAVWVSVLGEGLKSRAEIEDLVAAVRQANLNTIVAQVQREGATMFPSSFQPRHASIAKQSGFDPLATLLEVARDTSGGGKALKVHAWFNVFRLGEQKAYLKSSPPPIAKTHSEWYTRDHAGKVQHELDPGVPAVQDHLITVIEECIQKYDVDGINLDYIRYFGEDRGYNPWAMKRFYQQTSIEGRPEIEDPAWSQFKRDQVSNFVRRCAITVWTVRPQATFSVNAVGWGAAPHKDFSDTQPYFEAMQDWDTWVKAGWVDTVLQMSYKREWEPDQKQQYRNWANYTENLVSRTDGRIVTMGIGGYFNPIGDALNQYREALDRNLGTSLFAYDRPTKEAAEGKGDKQGPKSKIWDQLRTEIYPEPIPAPTPDWREHLSMIAGYLLDDTGTPMDHVEVSLENTGYSAYTDGAGFVAFSGLPPGTYRISCPDHAIGGSEVETRAGGVTWIAQE